MKYFIAIALRLCILFHFTCKNYDARETFFFLLISTSSLLHIRRTYCWILLLLYNWIVRVTFGHSPNRSSRLNLSSCLFACIEKMSKVIEFNAHSLCEGQSLTALINVPRLQYAIACIPFRINFRAFINSSDFRTHIYITEKLSVEFRLASPSVDVYIYIYI